MAAADHQRPYRSGAFASARSFTHGRFEAEIRATRGPGLVTGFFLHRHGPRQEIDIELTGDDPCRMLANVYFNPGDEGAAMTYGYRGSPCRLELGFNASEDFHLYTVEWRPGRISWSVDNVLLHERGGWDPTPVPHLPCGSMETSGLRAPATCWVHRRMCAAVGRRLPQRHNLDLKASSDGPGRGGDRSRRNIALTVPSIQR